MIDKNKEWYGKRMRNNNGELEIKIKSDKKREWEIIIGNDR